MKGNNEMKVGSKLKVKYVKHNTAKGVAFTTFSVGEKVRNGNGWQYFNFMVWGEHVDLADGDTVFVTAIDSIGASEYNGKVTISVFGRVDVDKNIETQFEKPKPTQFVQDVAPTFTIDTSESDLPFDL